MGRLKLHSNQQRKAKRNAKPHLRKTHVDRGRAPQILQGGEKVPKTMICLIAICSMEILYLRAISPEQ